MNPDTNADHEQNGPAISTRVLDVRCLSLDGTAEEIRDLDMVAERLSEKTGAKIPAAFFQSAV